MAVHPTYQVWCAVDSSGREAGYSYPELGYVWDICEYDWWGQGYSQDWEDREYSLYGQLDWGLEYCSQLPTIGGDGVTELPLYVQHIDSEIQYRIVLYFELVSLVNFEE